MSPEMFVCLHLIDQALGCACFPEFLHNFSERHILWSLCSVVFHALTLKLPIQTSLSVAPKLPVSLCSGGGGGNVKISGKQAHPWLTSLGAQLKGAGVGYKFSVSAICGSCDACPRDKNTYFAFE